MGSSITASTLPTDYSVGSLETIRMPGSWGVRSCHRRLSLRCSLIRPPPAIRVSNANHQGGQSHAIGTSCRSMERVGPELSARRVFTVRSIQVFKCHRGRRTEICSHAPRISPTEQELFGRLPNQLYGGIEPHLTRFSCAALLLTRVIFTQGGIAHENGESSTDLTDLHGLTP